MLMLPVGAAHAADPLLASEPRAKQELTRPPGWVTLGFGHELDNGVAKLVVTNSKGEPVTKNAPIVEGSNITMQLDDGLGKDTYTVHYRVNSANGDLIGGAFQFAYGKGKWTTIKDAAWQGSQEQPPVLSETDPWGRPTQAPPATPLPEVEVVQSGGPTISVTAPTPPAPSPDLTDGVESVTSEATETPQTPTTPGTVDNSPGVNVGLIAGIVALVAAAGGGIFFWMRRKR